VKHRLGASVIAVAGQELGFQPIASVAEKSCCLSLWLHNVITAFPFNYEAALKSIP